MANDETLSIVITARDDASRVLDQARTKFTGFGQELERLDRGGGRTFDNLGSSVQNLAIRFTRVLDPALGGTVASFSRLGTSLLTTAGAAGTLATVVGGTVVTAVAVAGLGLNTYINTLSRLSQEQAKTNALLNDMDFGGLTGRAQGLNRQMLDLQATFSAWQAVKNVTTGALNEIGGALDKILGKGPSDFIRRFGTDTQAISEASQARAGANAAIEKLVPGQRDRLRTGTDILGFQTGGALAGGRAQEALARQDATTFLAEMHRREQQLSNELDARERGIGQDFEPQVLAARASGAGPGRMALLQEQQRSQQEALGRTTAFETLRRQRSAGAEAIGLALSGQLGDPNLSQVAPIAGTEADAALSERRLAADLAGLDIIRQRAEILGEITPELNAQLILMERDLLLGQSGLTIDEQRLVNSQANLALLEQQARLDPLAGLQRGFSEAATASREWGSEMLQVARETDRNMSRTFSDGLFNLFTGRKGEDLGKQFGESILRSITDTLGRQAAGAVSGIFSQLLGGARGAVPSVTGGGGGGVLELLGGLVGQASGQVVSPTGAPAGSFIMTAGGQLAQVMPSGALTAVGGGAGGGGIGFDANTVLSGGQALYGGYAGLSTLASNFAVGGATGALFGVPTVVAGGTVIAVPAGTTGYALAELGAVGVEAGVGAGTSGLVGTGGSLFATGAGAATGGVLAAVALGFTIYGGLTQEATAQNIAINAVSGALSGAVLGAAIGFIGGPVGSVIGAAIGAIVGGAAAGGTTGLKAPRKMTTGERSLAIGEQAANNLTSAIQNASSIEDLVTIFNTRWAPHGEVQILTAYLGVTYYAGDFDDAAGAAATPALMVIPEFLDALDIRVGQTGAPQSRPDLITAFRAKRDELLGILSNVPYAILEHDAAAGISRRTYSPLQTIYSLAPGTHALGGSSEFLRRDLAADDATIDFLMDRMRERSIRRDVDMSREDFMFR